MFALSSRSALATVLTLCAPPLVAQQLSFSDPQWKFQGDSTKVETFDGRQVLRIDNGAAARPDVRLQDGTIDVDVMTSRRRSFVYFNFRVQNDGEYEDFYLRPHKSTLPTPRSMRRSIRARAPGSCTTAFVALLRRTSSRTSGSICASFSPVDALRSFSATP